MANIEIRHTRITEHDDVSATVEIVLSDNSELGEAEELISATVHIGYDCNPPLPLLQVIALERAAGRQRRLSRPFGQRGLRGRGLRCVMVDYSG